MLDLETCKELKAAGMPWEPKKGNQFYHESGLLDVLSPEYAKDTKEAKESAAEYGWTYCPRLDDLLARIEGEGWNWTIGKQPNGGYRILVWQGKSDQICFGDSPESAAAAAVIWILQTKNKEG